MFEDCDVLTCAGQGERGGNASHTMSSFGWGGLSKNKEDESMGTRGPVPIPTKILKRRGTYRVDRAPKHEPVPNPATDLCPSVLPRLCQSFLVLLMDMAISAL